MLFFFRQISRSKLKKLSQRDGRKDGRRDGGDGQRDRRPDGGDGRRDGRPDGGDWRRDGRPDGGDRRRGARVVRDGFAYMVQTTCLLPTLPDFPEAKNYV